MRLSKVREINKSRELDLLINSSLMQRRVIYSCLAVMDTIVPKLQELSYDEVKKWLVNNPEESLALRTYNIEIQDFAKTWGIQSNTVLGNLKKAIGYDPSSACSPEIMKLCFRHYTNDGSVKFINVISSVEINKNYGVVSIELTDSILPYLINLKSYAKIPFQATLGFKCNHSFTMIEYLLRRYTRNSTYPNHELNIETLHLVLGTNNLKSYKNWAIFKSKVLDQIEKDFSAVSSGNYNITFEPLLEKNQIGKGRPKVSKVLIKFDNSGFKKFLENQSNKTKGLEYFEECNEEMLGRSRIARHKYELEKQKEKDKKDSKETLLSDKKAEEQLSLANLLNDDDDFDLDDENLPF